MAHYVFVPYMQMCFHQRLSHLFFFCLSPFFSLAKCKSCQLYHEQKCAYKLVDGNVPFVSMSCNKSEFLLVSVCVLFYGVWIGFSLLFRPPLLQRCVGFASRAFASCRNIYYVKHTHMPFDGLYQSNWPPLLFV